MSRGCILGECGECGAPRNVQSVLSWSKSIVGKLWLKADPVQSYADYLN